MRQSWRGIALLLGAFTTLCTLFAAVVTAADAWRDHVHAAWPLAQARVARCEMREYRGRGKSWYIRCRFTYLAAGQDAAAQIDSRTVPDPARDIWQSAGTPGLGDLQAWVDAHPPDTPVELHYSPANPGTAVLVATDMPLAGPKAAGDLRVLRLFAIPSLVLLLLGLLGRGKNPRPPRIRLKRMPPAAVQA